MTGPGAVWFTGDPDDPWVASISEALPGAVWLTDGDAPAGEPPGVVVLHRAVLTGQGPSWLDRLRASDSPPRVVLVFGPHVRHADLERWAGLIDVAIPEATARDTLARVVSPGAPRRAASGPRPGFAVVSTNPAVRETLAEACAQAGYPTVPARDWSDAPGVGPAVWDVPVLDPGWPQALERRAKAGGVVALIGLADRGLVAEARARGASACLDLPVDLADLTAALDRLAAAQARPEPAHAVPPPPAGRRHPSPARPVADPPGRT